MIWLRFDLEFHMILLCFFMSLMWFSYDVDRNVLWMSHDLQFLSYEITNVLLWLYYDFATSLHALYYDCPMILIWFIMILYDIPMMLIYFSMFIMICLRFHKDFIWFYYGVTKHALWLY